LLLPLGGHREGNLTDKLDGKPQPARETAKLVEALARAMQLAHSRNVVHRDLKPANVLRNAGIDRRERRSCRAPKQEYPCQESCHRNGGRTTREYAP